MINIERIVHDATACRVSIRAHELTVDAGVTAGGRDAGPGPHDLYDSALGTCTALTVLWYAQRNEIPVEDVSVTIDRDATDERHGQYRLSVQLAVTGPLDDAQRSRLLAVAEKCPVHKLMTDVTTVIETAMVKAE